MRVFAPRSGASREGSACRNSWPEAERTRVIRYASDTAARAWQGRGPACRGEARCHGWRWRRKRVRFVATPGDAGSRGKKTAGGKGGIEGECPRPFMESRAGGSLSGHAATVFVVCENDPAIVNNADEGRLRAFDRFMIAAREGSHVVHHYAFNRVLEAF